MIHRGHNKHHEHEHANRHASEFRVTARRNKLLGLWAAELMKMPVEQHEAYARDVIAADLEEPTEEDVIRKVLGDFANADVSVSRDELIKKMTVLTAEARSQLEAN